MQAGTQDRWILVPGTLCTHEVFTPLLDALRVATENRTFVEADLPKVEDYAPRLREASPDGAIVCGFSLGSLILAHNLQAVKQARALVLLAANPFPDPIGNRAKREAVRDRILGGGARDWIFENWSAMAVDQSEDLQNFVASMAEKTVPSIAAQTELAISRPGADADLEQSDLPILFVTGAEDQLTPPDPLIPIAEAARHARREVLSGVGHFALLEAPERVAGCIVNGLKDLRVQSSAVEAYT